MVSASALSPTGRRRTRLKAVLAGTVPLPVLTGYKPFKELESLPRIRKLDIQALSESVLRYYKTGCAGSTAYRGKLQTPFGNIILFEILLRPSLPQA